MRNFINTIIGSRRTSSKSMTSRLRVTNVMTQKLRRYLTMARFSAISQNFIVFQRLFGTDKIKQKSFICRDFFATATNQRKTTFFWRASLRSKKIYLQFEEKRRGISSLEQKLNFSWVVTHLFARFINKLNDIYWLLFIFLKRNAFIYPGNKTRF